MYAGVAVLSFGVTKVFSHLARQVEKYRLVSYAYLAIIVAKLLLGNWLRFGGKPAVVCFYFFASVYFLLAIATLWACVNDMFTAEQGERCFGFVALGSTVGGIIGSHMGKVVAQNEALRDKTLYFSILFLAAALGLIQMAARIAPLPEKPKTEDKQEPQRGDFWSELRALAQRPYIRNIALSVLLLAVATTAVEFVSQTVIDRDLARVEYNKFFADVPGAEFQTIYELKTRSAEDRSVFLASLGESSGLGVEKVTHLFEEYREELEAETRSFFGETYAYQGIAGVISLLIVARFLFPRVGMRYCYTLLPIVSLAGLSLFGLAVDLLVVQIVIVLIGALNYSLNNAAKEILFSATDEETLFRFKPMIEGPCMRAGDVVSSILKLSVGAVAASFALASSTLLFVVVTITFLLPWLVATWKAGSEYDFVRRKRSSDLPTR